MVSNEYSIKDKKQNSVSVISLDTTKRNYCEPVN